MHRLIWLVLLIIASSIVGTETASAGPNAGGTLIVALSEGTVYSPDLDYCGSVTTPTCDAAVTESASDGTPVVLNVLAAFNPPGGRLAGIVWGMTYPSNVAIVDFGHCGDFELPNEDWPASGSGTAITWNSAETDPLVPVYWLAAYGYDGPGSLVLGEHPTQGGQFGDDAVPTVTDDIAGFGSFGFGMIGSVVCPIPSGDPTGACCIGSDCSIQTSAECEIAGGVYQGDATSCEPDPCLQPQCDVDPTSIDFGPVDVGAFADSTFTITNNGGVLLEGTITDSCPDFAILGDPSYSLLPGEFKEFTVQFSPLAEGPVNCDLDLGIECGPLPLSGTGSSQPACVVETPDPDEPLSLLFGEVGTGRSRDLSFTITNEGDGILSGVVTEACEAFAIIGPAEYELGSGEIATIIVRFSPNVEGPHECPIDTGAECPEVIAIGQGVAPPICAVDPIDLDFGAVGIGQSEDRIFTITNNGVGDLEGVVTEGCPQFSLVGGGAYSLGAGESQDIRVRFQPTSTGPASCDLFVGQGCSDVTAHGEGEPAPDCVVFPTSLDFGVVTIGESRDLNFEVRNVGGGVVSGTVIESCGAYEIVGPAGYSLEAGESKEFTLRFTPQARGVADCLLESNCGDITATGVGDDAPACLFTPPALIFGDVPLGESAELVLKLTNVGGQVLSGTLSSGCPEFELIGDGDYSLTRGQEKQFTVRFTPAETGPRVCVLTSGTPVCEGPQAVGRGIPGVSCAVSPDSLQFEEVFIGTTEELVFSITNEGEGTLTGSVQAECGEFSVLGDLDYSLGASASKEFTVQFHPTSVGPASCKLATGAACDSIPLSGIAIVPPSCLVEPTELDFGPIAVGSFATREFMVTNAGDGRLQGTVSESCDDFTVQRAGGGDLAYDLESGASATFEVRFEPASEGDAECTIAVGDSCSPMLVNGSGVMDPVCTVEPDSLFFGLVPIGETAESSLLVRNDGGGVLIGSVVSDCPQIEIVNGAYELGAGGEAEVLVRFTPSDLGPFECTVATGPSCDPVVTVGEGDSAPECGLSENVIDLGTTTVSDSLVATLTVTNVGGGILTGTVQSTCPEFTIRGSGDYALARDESADITIVFHPSAIGDAECVLDTGGSCPDVLVRAAVEPDPVCVVSTDFLDFGEVPVGGTADRRFTVRNIGGGTLEGTVSAECEAFEIFGDSLYALGNEDSMGFTIRFRPEEMGSFGCLIGTGGSCQGVVVTGIARSSDGACCFPDFSCHIGSSADCEVAGGTYLGDGTTCEDSPCAPAGACCVGEVCTVVTEAACTAGGGIWTEGEDCGSVDCGASGACCYPDGACTLVSQAECEASSGTYQGDGVSCEVAACEVLGACCFADGECYQFSEIDCLQAGGRIWSANTRCEDLECAPVGACCTSEGDCLVVTEAECGNGTYQGDSVSCGPETCEPPGACCQEDGTCTIVDEASCDGLFLGGATVCTPELCVDKVDEVTIVPAASTAEFRVRTSGSAVQNLQGWYRVGGTRDYQQIASFTHEGDTWTGEFDRDDYTVRGLEYYLTYTDTGIDLLVSYGNSDAPHRMTVEGEATAPPLTPYRYRMVSAPLVIADPAGAYALVRSRFGDPGAASWRMGWWDPALETYVTLDPEHPRGFESGSAYWLAFAAPQEPWVLGGRSKLPVEGSTRFARTLAPGWNMVGNPAAYEVSLSSDQLWIDDRGTVTRFDQARDNALVSDVFVYDPSRSPDDLFYPYVVRPSSLSMWGGCWVENRTDHEITLLIPAVEASLVDGLAARTGGQSSLAMGGDGDPLGEVAWAFSIRARTTEASGGIAEQATVVLAVDPGARDSEDRFDLQIPPAAPGSRIRLSIEGMDRSLLLDARNDRESEPVWIVSVECETPVELTWDDPSRADTPDWTLHLRREGGREWDLRTLRALPLDAGRHRIEIRGRNGSPPPVSVETLTLAIEPNPFRESTVFRFALPAAARAVLSVFDASGQRVWELPEQEMSAGEHAFVWTGRDAGGVRVPAGAYFVRLRAAGLDRTERFVLLK